MKTKRSHIIDESSDIDLARLIPELLKALRGRSSQGQINQRMGYSYSQVYRWEAGRKMLAYEEFVDFCTACRKDDALQNALRHGFGFRGDAKDTRLLLATLCGDRPLKEVLAGLRCSRFQYSRWASGKTKVPLETILAGGLFFRRSLLYFLELLVDTEKLPSISQAVSRRQRILKTFFDRPYTVAILKSLESSHYLRAERHDEKILSELAGVSAEEMKAALKELLEAELIHYRHGKYFATTQNVSTVGDRHHRIGLYEYWFRRSLKKLARMKKDAPGSAESVFSLRFVNLSQRRYEHVVKNANSIFGAFLQLLAEDLPGEPENKSESQKTYLFQMHLMNLAESEEKF